MHNVEIKTDGKGIMTIKVDTKKEHGLSKSGKTISIASTGGNIREGEVHIGLNVYRYPEPKPE